MEQENLIQRIQQLNEIGVSLSKERDHEHLLEMILIRAKELTGADAGSLYTLSSERTLHFSLVVNDTLNLCWGGKKGAPVKFPSIPLYDSSGNPNDRTVVAHATLSKQTINIENCYGDNDYDFSGTRQFDNQSGYRSQSILVVPMLDQEGKALGALQLINRIDPTTGEVCAFDTLDQNLVESLASQAAIAVSRRRLINNLNEMFEGLIEVLAEAIDARSPHTGQHCRRVPEITMLLADAVNKMSTGPLSSTHFSEDELYQLKVASWLHDCGKVTTPVHIVDKATRLESIVDRLDLIHLRFEVLRRDIQLAHARGEMSDEQLEERLRTLQEDRCFVEHCNKAATVIEADDALRITAIAERTWVDHEGQVHPILLDVDVRDLQIQCGTLNADERQVINDHAMVTLKMLQKLPLPAHLEDVPEIAASHHERVDGKGYPRGLTGEEMSTSARLLAIADVFEALTANNRPYKKAIPLPEVLAIMEGMARSGHLDPDLYEVFVRSKVHEIYAEKYLNQKKKGASSV